MWRKVSVGKKKNFYKLFKNDIITKSQRYAVASKPFFGRVAQLGRAPRSQRGGRRFDPDHVHHLKPRENGVFKFYTVLRTRRVSPPSEPGGYRA